ncbi:hypothetical protein PGTUg99_014757 [Puccinia graminis f. sp. tritici]|uniref:Uncharacterized protein n=1 Tax=Puccinia graminis f. sp. tritici TaxID=56615 RepID=A0A5B0RHW5_PUCGR|nr:hypothetical protein PGTUg99_014757 [Puccinia graminis f. sp. tritici]
MLTLRFMVLTALIAKAWAAMFLCDIGRSTNPNHTSRDYMILDSQAPQGIGTVILTKLDNDGGQTIFERVHGIEFRNELNTNLWVYDGDEYGKLVKFQPHGVARLILSDQNRLWVATIEKPYNMRIPLSVYKGMVPPLLKAIKEDRFTLQEPKVPKHQEAMAHLNQKGVTNAQPKMERSWEYPLRENPSEVRSITLTQHWGNNQVNEVQYSGKSWWIIHRDFISDSKNSEGLPFRIMSGRLVVKSKKNRYRVVKNVGKRKSIAVHVGDFSSLLPTYIDAGKESSIFFNKLGDWAVITFFDQAAPLQHNVYKLLTSWNQDLMKNIKLNQVQVEEGIRLSWRERIIHSCAKMFKQERSDYQFLGKVRAN